MPAPVVERFAGYGWARRALWGGAGTGGAVARGLALPLSWVWRTAAGARLGVAAGAAERLAVPTVSVGNVTVGGGGKTSLVRGLLAEGLPEGARAAVLTRG
ncbi:MAG TPA: tetraacyldisaccharide 4'-kinase, partial [Gemmatimonadota bacterium]|nr:tetraacyldisaccharide 4'-kinase [Gemmatimonadota bacterium]